jgi:hypothetical protein
MKNKCNKIIKRLKRRKKKIIIFNKKLFLFANSIYIIINIFFLYHLPNKDILKFINNSTIFKNIDKYTFSLLTNSYEKLGNYINNKYNIHNNSSNLKIPFGKTEKKKTIRIHAVNLFSKERFKSYLLWYLKDTFNVQFDDINPDYLIYNVFGNKENKRKYYNTIKIATISL